MGAQWKVKHKEAAANAKGKIFGKLVKEITIAARNGADTATNAHLRLVVEQAKKASMPKETLERAIKKGAGLLGDAVHYERLTYEGFAPHQVPLIVECLTDNINRTAADVRSTFTHSGGNLGTAGSVAFQFTRKGSIAVDKVIKSDDKKVADKDNASDEDEFMMAVAEAGGDDYEDAGDQWIVWTAYDKMQDVQKGLEAQGLEVKGSELTMVPTTPTQVSTADAKKVQRLVDRLEELEDVQNVYHTMEMTDEVVAALEEDE